MYKRVALAVDGSENSLRATQEAIKLASLSPGCQVDVLNVADYSKSKDEVLHSYRVEELDIQRRRKLVAVEELLKQNGIIYHLKILHGDPALTIVDYTEQENIELAIMGSRGLNMLQEMIMGSVSHKVMKLVQCPVIIVK